MEFPTTTMAAVEAVALLLVTICAYFYWKYKDFPPGPYGLPVLGYAPFLGSKPHVTLSNMSKKYGPVFSITMGNGQPVIVVSDWPSIREVLVRQGEAFAVRPFSYVVHLVLQGKDGKDIIGSSGPVMKELKRSSTNILKEFGMGRSSLEDMVIPQIEKLSTYLKTKDNESVALRSIFFTHLVNIVWRLTGGVTYDTEDPKMKSFADALHEMSSEGMAGFLNVWPFLRFIIPDLSGYRRIDAAAKKLNAYTNEVVQSHWNGHMDDGRQPDFIYRFIDEIKKRQDDNTDKPPYSNEHLIGVTLNLFVGGIETTATTLHWSIVLMACHPRIQEKVQAELDKVMAKEENLPYTSRTLVPYTQATLLEIQRYASIIPLSGPHCTGKDASLFGYKIPKGTTVLTNLWALHHDVEYWGDPDKFRPERFLAEDGSLIRHDSFIPFSAGPRVCLGEPLAKVEIALFFTSLMRRFSFQLDPSQKTESLLEPLCGFSLRLPAAPLLVKSR